ncbi:MAG: hypothetical protein ACTHN8_05770 [Angustibacter sp.]
MREVAAALVPLAVVVGLDAWVYLDAGRRQGTACQVSVTVAGRLTLDSPVGWLVGCVVLFVVVFPLYLVARSRSAGGS